MKVLQNTMFFDRKYISAGYTRWGFDPARLTEEGRKQVDTLINQWGLDVTIGQHYTMGTMKPFGIHFQVEKPRIEEAVLLPDKPWETLLNYANTIFDKKDSKYKLWYSVLRTSDVKLTYKDGTDFNQKWLTCYAESEDGIHWTKPDLNYILFNSEPTNILDVEIDSSTVFIDPNPTDGLPYKAGSIGVDWSETIPDGQHVWFYLLGSRDGFEWKPLDTPKLYGFFDTQNVVAYDALLEKYVIYFRNANCGRAISRSEMDSLEQIPAPMPLMHPSCQDPFDTDYYTNGFTVHPHYPEMRLFFSSMFHHSADYLDIRLGVSSDGRVFEWVTQEPVIGNMDSAGRRFNSVYAYPNLLPIKDEVGLMFVRNAAGHDDWSTMCYGTKNESKYNMALWNKDRLVGVAADETGEFFTSLNALGGKLQVNYRTFGPKGFVKLEIQKKNRPVEGYDLDSCKFLAGDGNWEDCTWGDKQLLEGLSGDGYNIRIHLENAILYGIRVLGDDDTQMDVSVKNNVL